MELKNVRLFEQRLRPVNPKLADLLLGYIVSDELEIDPEGANPKPIEICCHETQTTPDGNGAFCRLCGETMA